MNHKHNLYNQLNFHGLPLLPFLFFLIPKQHFLNIPLNDLKLYKENCESVSQSEMPWLTAEKQFCNIMQTACI